MFAILAAIGFKEIVVQRLVTAAAAIVVDCICAVAANERTKV